jgi:hypothetical protein
VRTLKTHKIASNLKAASKARTLPKINRTKKINQERKEASNPSKTRKARKAIRPKNLATHKIKSRQTKARRASPLKVLIRNPPKTPSTTFRNPNQARRMRDQKMKKVNKLGPLKPARAKATKVIRLAA